MVFQSDTYSVLLVSANEKLNTAVTSLLPPTDFFPVDTVGSVSKARRLLLEKAYDLILVNSPLPDGSGVRFCMDSGADSQAGILLMAKRELYEELYYKLLPCGVITLAMPTSREVLTQAVRDLCVLRERARQARGRQATVEEKMEELRLVNKAKWLLIEKQRMTEAEAHRYIIKTAMEQRVSKQDVSRSILKTAAEEQPPSIPSISAKNP